MATQKTIVNNILRRLRETEVSTVSSTAYSKFIGQLVNDAIREMNDIWFWTVNMTAVDTTITGDSSTVAYNLSGTNDRSFLIRSIRNDKIPMAYDITANEEAPLENIAETERLESVNGYKGTIPALDQPLRFSVVPQTDGTWSIYLEQPSSSARTWRTWWYIPQGDLALDGTDDDTTVNLPQHPIEMIAMFNAQYERGEAQPGGMEQQKAQLAVAAAMEIDMQTNRKSDAGDMTNLELLQNQLYSGMIY